MTLEKTIEGYLTLSVTDGKRLGYFRQGSLCKGSIKWINTNTGEKTAEIGFMTDTRNVPFARLAYEYNGTSKDYTVTLRWKPSNLNPTQGYYYFVCPVTGVSCRKLYLVGGRFVSRWAFSAMYEKQTKSRAERSGGLLYLSKMLEAERLENQRYRKVYYRGNLTPYGRKLNRLYEQAERAGLSVFNSL